MHARRVVVLQRAEEKLVHGVVELLPGEAVQEAGNCQARAQGRLISHGWAVEGGEQLNWWRAPVTAMPHGK